MAKMIINQAGIAPGVAGQSRSDGLRTGALVTVTHDAADAVFTEFSLLWAPTDDFTAASSFAQVGTHATFSPDPTSKGGTYRIRMRVSTASTTTDVIRLFAVRTAIANLRIPALNERADETASLTNHGASTIAASEFNEPSISGPFAGGNYGGWYSAINELATKVESLASGGGVAKSMSVLYAVDFTAQASQTMTAAGSYTIDGKTWWAKGSIPNGGVCALVNGSGLRLEQPASIGTVVDWRGSGLVTYPGRLLAMAVAQIANFNPLAPVAFEWRFASPNALSGNSNEYAFGGICDVVASSAALTGTEKGKSLTMGRYADSSGVIFMRSPYGPSQINFYTGATGTVFGTYVQGIYRVASSTYYPLFGAYTAMGVPDDYQTVDDNVTPAFRGAGISSSPSFIFGLEKGASDAYDLDVYLTHLSILQPNL